MSILGSVAQLVGALAMAGVMVVGIFTVSKWIINGIDA